MLTLSLLEQTQTLVQALVNEHPITVILGAFGGLATLLGLALKLLAGVFLKSIAKLEAKVDGFTQSLADHGNEDDRRFDQIGQVATQRHEALMETIQDHAERVTGILTPLQVTVGVLDENMKGLRSDIKNGAL